MEPHLKLYDSFVCRLCAEENINGSQIYNSTGDGDQLSDMINKYLPLKVSNDGKFPCTLCPGCTIQLEATKSFFDLIVEGQKKLQTLLTGQQNNDVKVKENSDKEQLDSALKLVNPNSSVQTYSVQSDASGENIFIEILLDGPLFPSDHDLSMKLNNEKPKKKRGRPLKSQQIEESNEIENDQPSQEEANKGLENIELNELVDGLGKPRRRIKKPLKYSDLIQGKELDQVFLEEGISDEDDEGINDEVEVQKLIKDKPVADFSEPKVSDPCLISKSPKTSKKKAFDCEICGRSFLNQSRMEMHRAFHKDIFYQCITCSKSFDSKDGFTEHLHETKHDDFKLIEFVDNYGQVELPKSVENDLTTIKFSEQAALSEITEKLKCELCEKAFATKQNLDVHHKAVHNNMKPYSCEKCDKQFPYLSSYKTHSLQHESKTHPCDQCEKIFSHPSSLVYHRETEHNNGRKFVCNKCKKSFKHKQLLLRHQLVHTSERPFVCSECKAAFKTRANLINHMATHTKEKKFFCTECGLCFPYKTSLNLHQRWHNGQKDYECDVCMKTFSQKGNMVEHRRIHTGEKPFCCTYCGRRFTTSSQYKLHVKRHTGERPWRCEYCSKTFLHKDTWRSHTRRHRNERPYLCSYCLRGFTEAWALKKHLRLHTGEKPYTCDICGKSFADSSNLKKHTRTHNKDQSISQSLKKSTEESINDMDNSQVLYLTYDPVSDNNQPALTNNLKAINNGEVSVEDENQENLFNDDLMQGASTEEISIDVQQLVDNDGNVISITTEDGQQIKVVTTMDDDQCIQGLMPDGTLIPLNLSTQGGKPVAELITNTHMETSSLIQQTELNPMELLNPEDTNSDKNKIQFLNEDGQNLCFIAYGLESNPIGENQFININ